MKKPKTPITLGDVKYLSIGDGYFFGDSLAPRHGGPSAKYLFIDVGRKFYKAVAAEILERVPHFTSKITVNAGGPAVAGDVSMGGWMHQRALYSSLVYEPNGNFARLFWRIGTGAYAIDGANVWVEAPSTTSDQVAAAILAGMEHILGASRSTRG
jgi:hypothetical protein